MTARRKQRPARAGARYRGRNVASSSGISADPGPFDHEFGSFIGVIASGVSDEGTLRAPQIQVVLNWFTELQQRVPTR